MYCSTLVSVKVLEGAFYKEKVLLVVLCIHHSIVVKIEDLYTAHSSATR